MSSFIINGPASLNGSVKVQGAKNSAMKHIFIPLISEGEYLLKNIPRIGSIDNHIRLIKAQGAKVKWMGKNSLKINSKYISKPGLISKDLLYYTSDANKLIPILALKYGKCIIEIDPERSDRGGDQIGSRRFNDIFPTLNDLGIEHKYKNPRHIIFTCTSYKAFKYNAPIPSFTISVLALFSALFKKGKSELSNYTKVKEFFDIIDFLLKAGAKIKILKDKIVIEGPTKLKNVSFTNMYDVHDLVTWISAGLSTNSKLKIIGCQYKKMGLDPLEKIFKEMNAKINLQSSIIDLIPQLDKLKPVKIIAGFYPDFVTEWQVLISPLLTQINGESHVVETLFSNRMQHWNEMAKMGTVFDYFKHPKYPESEGKPRAVKVIGPQQLFGAEVEASDVRTGAALIITSLIANRKTKINNIEHILRGYEDIDKRLKFLGVNIKKID